MTLIDWLIHPDLDHVHVTRGRRPPKRTIVFSLAQGRSSGLAGRGVGHKVTAAPAAVTSRLESAPKPPASPYGNPLGPRTAQFHCPPRQKPLSTQSI